MNEMEQERLDELAESDPEYVQGVKGKDGVFLFWEQLKNISSVRA